MRARRGTAMHDQANGQAGASDRSGNGQCPVYLDVLDLSAIVQGLTAPLEQTVTHDLVFQGGDEGLRDSPDPESLTARREPQSASLIGRCCWWLAQVEPNVPLMLGGSPELAHALRHLLHLFL